jgi:AsmA protein
MAETVSSNKSSKRFPLWAKIALAVFAVLILIALSIPYFLNVDRYRETIAAAIQKQTGRSVSLGKIQAHVLPGIALVVQNLHVGNPQGFPAGDVVSAEEIRVNLALGPLLSRKIHINSIDLVRPKLTLVTDSGGKDNYTFSAASPAPASASGDQSSELSLDQIDQINLTGAEVFLGSVVKGAVALVADTKGINITLRNFVLNPMNMHDWQANSNLSDVTLSLGGWNQPIAFHSGQMTLSGGKLDAQFVADLAKASDVKGTLSVPDFAHPQANFEISASQLDIDKLIAAAGSGPAVGSSEPPKPVAPAKGPSELVAHGHINVEKITTKPYTVGPANVEIRVYTDRAELWPISIGMYGGTLQISSRVDRSSDPARFTANVQMRNLDVAKVLDVTPSARGKMGGTGELDLPQLAGSLSGAWKKTLSGAGKFAVRNGHLPGVNLSNAAQSIAKLAGVGGDTPFTVLEGDFNIADQRVSSKQIHLDSPSGIVDLRGSVSLDGALDYQGQVTVNPAGALGTKGVGAIVGGLIGSRVGKITVPFALGGTIESPKVTPGKGVPSFGAPSTTAGSAPSGATPAQPVTPEKAVDTLKGLFGKH